MKYLTKCFRIYMWNILQLINKCVLKTYPLIEDRARCEDCGRNVHDFHTTDNLWMKIIGDSTKIFCFDCFVNRATEKGEFLITADVYAEQEGSILAEAKETIKELLDHLPDSTVFDKDDSSWEWCWDELNETAQNRVSLIRKKATSFLERNSES